MHRRGLSQALEGARRPRDSGLLAEAQSAVGTAFRPRGSKLGTAGGAVGFVGVEVGALGGRPQALLRNHAVAVFLVDATGVRYVFTRDREPGLGTSTGAGQGAGVAGDGLLLEQLLDLADVGGIALQDDLEVRGTRHDVSVCEKVSGQVGVD